MLVGTALSLAAEGKRVVLVDMAEGRPLAKLLGSRSKGSAVRTISSGGQQLRLAVAPQDVTALDNEVATVDTDVVLLLATADPALGAEYLRPWAEDAVVVLRAGKVSNVLIEAVGQMLRDAGVHPVSAILTGADGRDETSGTVESVHQPALSPGQVQWRGVTTTTDRLLQEQ
jgi:Mrp family chromosome partitioning ATPase